ncbi:hypothetical protein SAMN05216233_11152 [Desulfoluna spongiiphila]|uniref:Uncharacterized protein n=1 Tax=Desulfoluna spongiiphila TaxID=419481 RepID=A0A1G5GPN7_9BACT|nr:hypothetical protein SAMN05216233_11152 [Desulfoluna spongiiphila]
MPEAFRNNRPKLHEAPITPYRQKKPLQSIESRSFDNTNLFIKLFKSLAPGKAAGGFFYAFAFSFSAHQPFNFSFRS